MALGAFTVTGQVEAPGVRIEMRDYAAIAPIRETSVQPVYTLGLRWGSPPAHARYPGMADAGQQFRGLGPIVFRPAALPWEVASGGERARVLLCAIDPDRFADLAGEVTAADVPALLRSFDIRSGFITQCLSVLQREAIQPGADSVLLVERVTDAMLLELRQHLRAPAAQPTARGLDPAALRRIEAALLGHWNSFPRAEDVAAAAGLGVRALQTRFREATGESLGACIARVQMEKAAALLRTSDLPLKEVAYRVGFAHTANFSTAFRRHYGVTPSAYRRTL